MNGLKIILTDDKKVLMVLKSTKFTRKTADKKDLVRLIHTRTKVAPKQSLVAERQDKVLLDSL